MSNASAVVENASFLFRSLYLPHEVQIKLAQLHVYCQQQKCSAETLVSEYKFSGVLTGNRALKRSPRLYLNVGLSDVQCAAVKFMVIDFLVLHERG